MRAIHLAIIWQQSQPLIHGFMLPHFQDFLKPVSTKSAFVFNPVRLVRHQPVGYKVSAFNSLSLSATKEEIDSGFENRGEDSAAPNTNASYIALASLLIASLTNQWSRQAINYMCDFSQNALAFKHINMELGFSQSSFAVLSSVGFTGIFILASLFAGRITDTISRNRVIALSSLVSSFATACQCSATSFSELVPLRALIGASQAFLNPAAFTLLAEYFPKESIGRINGIFSSGIYLGGGLASLSLLIDDKYGWKLTLLTIASAGFVAALINLFFLKDPRDDDPKLVVNQSPLGLPPAANDLAITKSNDVSGYITISDVLNRLESKLLLLASFIRFCAGFSIGTFKATFVLEKFPSYETLFSSSNAFIVAIGGLVSSLLGGIISDYIASSTRDSGSLFGTRPLSRCWVSAVGSLLAAPLWAAFILSPDPSVALGVLLLEYLAAECWIGPTLATLFTLSPTTSRGTAQSLFSVITALGSVGPVLVGALTDGGLGVRYALGESLLYFVGGAYLLSGVLFVAVAAADDKSSALNAEKVL